mgnify:CR=1 FL=1
MLYIAFFILGSLWGSFSNVCIYRLPNSGNVAKGRSFCPNCKNKIKWFDNIPFFSYLFLKGKCRQCAKPISFQYLVVELLSAISFVIIFHLYGISITTLLLLILSIFFIIIFFIDLKHFIIPDVLNFTLIGLAIFKNFIPNFQSNFTYDFGQSIIGGLSGYLIIWFIIFLYKKFKNIEAMGFGDAKLMTGIGLFFGWQAVFFILFLSAILGLISVIPSLLNNSKNLKTQIPFGPYIVISSVIYYFTGNFLLNLIII